MSLHGQASPSLSNKHSPVLGMPWRTARRRNLTATPVFPRPGRTGQHGHYPRKCRFGSVGHFAVTGAVRSPVPEAERTVCRFPVRQTDCITHTGLQNSPRGPRLWTVFRAFAYFTQRFWFILHSLSVRPILRRKTHTILSGSLGFVNSANRLRTFPA